jgi:hypothetical protein
MHRITIYSKMRFVDSNQVYYNTHNKYNFIINKKVIYDWHQLKVFQFLEGTQYFVWSSAPLLVALASFVTYVLIDPVNNILDSQAPKL